MVTDIRISRSGEYVSMYIETDEKFTRDEAFEVLKEAYKRKTGDELAINDTFCHDKLQTNSPYSFIKMVIKNGK